MDARRLAGPRLQTDNLPSSLGNNDPSATPGWSALSATASPARGKEMRGHLLNQLRPPQLTHTWTLWHEKPPISSNAPAQGNQADNNKPGAVPTTNPMNAVEFAPHLTEMGSMSDVKAFWQHYNSYPWDKVPQKNSVHLFHKTIVPIWEDPRNARGGAWNFRVPKSQSLDFWQHVVLLAIGEHLQRAVEDPTRQTFKDDICGVSLRPRFASTLVTIWNRDGNNQKGIDKIWNTVVEGLPQEFKPKEGQSYYKKHSEHEGFSAPAAVGAASGSQESTAGEGLNPSDLTATQKQSTQITQNISNLAKEIADVRKTMENVSVQDQAMNAKVEEAAKIVEEKKTGAVKDSDGKGESTEGVKIDDGKGKEDEDKPNSENKAGIENDGVQGSSNAPAVEESK
ncbi:MAG: hypothetical protein M1831_004756 [Alyxoria varia]|nr:MAG: hypothetical protein M1831_004756 [Alyxoria varia]